MANSSLNRYQPNLPQLLNPAQMEFINQKTPKQFIKQRPGPGGIYLDYVEVGYVINTLNEVFGYDWDFKILDQQIGKKQVWVKGELTARIGERTITKQQFGGSDIKLSKATNEAISIADSLKIAASDSLKKCASLLQVAGDVYWKDLDFIDSPTDSSRSRQYVAHASEIRP